jgi:heptaprenyl diphosphate synthase
MKNFHHLPELPTTEDVKIARFAAVAIALSVIEAAIPSPILGVKLGLSNCVILFSFQCYGLNVAAWVNGLRILGFGLLFGSLFTPGFMLSLVGGAASLVGLATYMVLPKKYFGLVSASLLAAWGHILGQLIFARYYLLPSDSILYLLPFFAFSATVTGVLNGILVQFLLQKYTQTQKDLAP